MLLPAVLRFNLGLPTTLREVGVAETQLPPVVRTNRQQVAGSPRPITIEAEVEAILRSAW